MFWSEYPKERDQLEDLGRDGRRMVILILKKQGWRR
jgi:hypothetical protein